MRDEKISLPRIKQLHPAIGDLVQHCVELAESSMPPNLSIRIVQGLRTFAEQDALYASGRTTQGPIVTHAKGGESYHNYGLAVDLVILIDGKADWENPWFKRVIVPVFVNNGFEWGGNWPEPKTDRPHFQKRFGYDWRDLLVKYHNENFISSTKYIVI